MRACSVVGRVAFIIENMLHFTKCLVCLAPFLFSHKQLEYTDSMSWTCSVPFSSKGIYIHVKSLFVGAECDICLDSYGNCFDVHFHYHLDTHLTARQCVVFTI